MNFQLNILIIRGLGLFVIALANIILAVILWRKSRVLKNKTIFYLSLGALFSGLFAFSSGANYFFWDLTPEYRLFWNKATWVGLFALSSLIIFVYSFVGKIKYFKIKLFFWYLTAAIFSFLALTTPYFIKSVYFNDPNIAGVSGSIDIVARIFILFGLSVILFYLLKYYFETNDIFKKLQIRYFIFGLIVYAVGGIIFGGIIPFIVGESAYYDIISFLSAFWIFFTAYAILKHHLLDIRIVIKKALIYSIIISLISGAMMAISLLSEWFTQNIAGFQSWIIPLFTGLTAFIIGRLFWKKSKEADKLKYEFITVVAHKLRTPLTKIKWSALSLKESKLEKMDEKEKYQIAYTILNANSKLLELTEQLLEVSKVGAQEYLYQLKPANLGRIAKEVIKNFQHQIERKHIKFNIKIEKHLLKTKLDELRIASAIQILLENAIAYTKDKINIEIKNEKKNIFFSIQDNGIGVSKQNRTYIFSKFFRTHEAYLKETEGMGIGLFIAKKIIERHNGKIGVESEGENKGSLFWFKVPRDR